MFSFNVVPAEGLEVIRRHRYRAGPATPIDRVLDTLVWTPALRLVPARIAPNLITLLGTVVMLSTLALTYSVVKPCPGAEVRGVGAALGPIRVAGMELKYAKGPDALPPWASWAIAAALFAYQTFDALDGKQARRARAASPLGQLFDHGCDALVTIIAGLNLSYALGFAGAASGMGRALVVIGALGMYAAQWEEGVTGVLRSQAGGVGPSEIQVVLIAAQAAAALLDCNTLRTPISLASTHAALVAALPYQVVRALAAAPATLAAALPGTAAAFAYAGLSFWVAVGLASSAVACVLFFYALVVLGGSGGAGAAAQLGRREQADAIAGFAGRLYAFAFAVTAVSSAASSDYFYTATLPANEVAFWVLAALGVSIVVRVVANVAVWHPHERPGARFAALARLAPSLILAASVLAYGLHPDTLQVLGLGRTAVEFGPSGHRMRLGRALCWPLLLAYASAQTLLTTATIVLGMAHCPVPAYIGWVPALLLAVPVVMDAAGVQPAALILELVTGVFLTVYAAWVGSAIVQISSALGINVLTIPAVPPPLPAEAAAAPAEAAKPGAASEADSAALMALGYPRAHARSLLDRAAAAATTATAVPGEESPGEPQASVPTPAGMDAQGASEEALGLSLTDQPRQEGRSSPTRRRSAATPSVSTKTRAGRSSPNAGAAVERAGSIGLRSTRASRRSPSSKRS